MQELDLTPIRPPHPLGNKFNLFLQEYQEDIRRIIGKFRYSSHHLEAEEIASRANLSLLKKREDILYEFEGDFDKNAFSRVAYTYVRNIIGWSHVKTGKDKYIKNRLDSIHATEEGPRTSFEAALDKEGYEELGFEAFDCNEKFSTLLRVIKEYCHILTDSELKILSCLESGMTHEKISDKFGFTRQAVSHSAINLFEKIKAHFSSDVLRDDNSRKVSEGKEAMHSFFCDNDGYYQFSDQDRKLLRKFLLSNVKLYTLKEIASLFMKGKYGWQQISSFCIKNKLTFCILKSVQKHKFSKDEEIEIANLYNQGKTAKEIGRRLSLDPKVISGKKGHLSRMGLIHDSLVKT
jgi:DNA-binding NarL/FixJ family response regulator